MWGGSVDQSCAPMEKNRIRGAVEQDERATYREALLIKAMRLKFSRLDNYIDNYMCRQHR